MVRHNQTVDFQDSPLLKAARLCSADVRTKKAGIGVADVLEYLEHDDWEAALLLLEDLGDAHPQPPEFWSLLADTARLMWLQGDADWYEWRCSEARNGAVRAELCLMRLRRRPHEARTSPAECFGPCGTSAFVTPEGEPLLGIARLWVEGRDPLKPGECGSVRLLPLTFEHWRHLKPGDVITMHEIRPLIGTARITEIISPVAATPSSVLVAIHRRPCRSRRTDQARWSRLN